MCRIPAIAFLLCGMGSLVHAQRIQLNEPLAREVSGDVLDRSGAPGLGVYAATTDGSRPTRLLSGIPAPGGDVLDFRITADGSRVVYRGDLDEDGVDELFLSLLQQPRRRATR